MLKTMENLAIIYKNKGRYNKIKKLYERIFANKEEKLGINYFNMLKTI